MESKYEHIVRMIAHGSKVLDVGCGDGSLLKELIGKKSARGLGIEIDERNILECIKKGVPVVQNDVDKGLPDYRSDSYDYVILSMTLQEVRNPALVIEEMVRIGKKGIVTIPNFAYWKIRLQILFGGRMPKSDALPYDWYNTPNIHITTVKDFKELCKHRNINIADEYPSCCKNRSKICTKYLSNFLSKAGLFVIERKKT